MSDVPELTRLVLDKLATITEDEAKVYFDVSAGTISAWKNGKNPPSLAAAQRVFDDTLKHQAPEATTGEKNRVELLLPMYEAAEPLFLFTLIRAMKLYGMDKIGIIPKIRTLITEARCDLAERFLLTGSPFAIMADCDMALTCGSGAMLRKQGLSLPEPKASRNAIERLMSHPEDKRIVGALYRDRRGVNKAQCEKAFSSAAENSRLLELFKSATGSDSLEENGWVGFGLVRIHRSVFLEMKEAAKPGGPLQEIAPPKGRETDAYGFFGRTSEQRGEDVVFCRRAGKIGIKTYVDTGCLLGHIGKAVY